MLVTLFADGHTGQTGATIKRTIPNARNAVRDGERARLSVLGY